MDDSQSKPFEGKKLLILDDEGGILQRCVEHFEQRGFEVDALHINDDVMIAELPNRLTSKEALQAWLDTHAYDAILTDFSMCMAFNGDTVIEMAKQAMPDAAVVVHSQPPNYESFVSKLIEHGADGVFVKGDFPSIEDVFAEKLAANKNAPRQTKHTDKLRFQGKKLLILDDSGSQLEEYKKRYEAYGFEVKTLKAVKRATQTAGEFYDKQGLLQQVTAFAPDAVLTDGFMIGKEEISHGVMATHAIIQVLPNVPIIMHTGAVDEMEESFISTPKEVMASNTKDMQDVGGIAAFGKSDQYVPEILDIFQQALAKQKQR